MAGIRPFRGIRYNPEHVRLGGVLAPPYDVISPAQQEALYGRNLRNVVRIDYGAQLEDDIAGSDDRYTRAAAFLESWLELGILVGDDSPALYVADHEFTHPDGGVRHRRGVLAVIPALPWEQAELRPHERTLSGPKEDRLALLRATRLQTSPVFGLWAGADARACLDDLTSGPPLLGGRTDGEMGSEKHLLWRVADAAAMRALQAALRPARLYVADGHHRYETAVAYAAERRAAEPDAPAAAPFECCLVYLADAGDAAVTILATHRLLLPGPHIAYSLDDLWARLDDAWDVDPVADVESGLRLASERVDATALVAVGRDGTALLTRAPRPDASPRQRLDVTVLELDVLAPAGVGAEAVAAGALRYTRDTAELTARVRGGEAVLGFALRPVSTAEVIAVADAGETMPQKSTYFYPKVPTGLVLYPV